MEQSSQRPSGPTAVRSFLSRSRAQRQSAIRGCGAARLESRGFAAIGIFTSSLRDRDAAGIPLALRLLPVFPDIIVNTVSFPVFTLSSPQHATAGRAGRAVRDDRRTAASGDLLRNIARRVDRVRARLESDGGRHACGAARMRRTGDLACPSRSRKIIAMCPTSSGYSAWRGSPAGWRRCEVKSNAEKRIGIVLSNAGGKAQRIGGAVGLDTPASLLQWLMDMRAAGLRGGFAAELCRSTDGAAAGAGLLRREASRSIRRGHGACRARAMRNGSTRSPTDSRNRCATCGASRRSSGPTIAPPFWRGNKQSARRSPLLGAARAVHGRRRLSCSAA